MAKQTSSYSKLLAQVVRGSGRILAAGSSRRFASISSSSLRVSETNKVAAASVPKPIDFGRFRAPTQAATATSQANTWSNLTNRVLSGGLPNLLGNIASPAGLGSLFSSVTNLFGGGASPAAQATYEQFQLPMAQNPVRTLSAPNATNLIDQNLVSPNGGGQVHIHVQAMDAQSLVDRSGDIARAVRTAMLNSHSINDVISEL